METTIITGQTGPFEEAMENADNDKILGKFDSQEDLVAAYLELEKKQGNSVSASGGTETVELAEVETSEVDAQEAVNTAGLDYDALSTEYEENGELSAQSYSALEKAGIPRDIVNNYISAMEAQGQNLAEQTANSIIEAAGGNEEFKQMVAWAADALSPEAIDAYNKAVNSGDAELAKIAVKGLMSQYQEQYGTDPMLVGGSIGSTVGDTFGSTGEMVRAMSDPRYETDDNYRKEVERKVIRSNLMHRR